MKKHIINNLISKLTIARVSIVTLMTILFLTGCTVSEVKCNHKNFKSLPSQKVTCTTDGLTQGAVCTDCGYTIVQQKVLPKWGHDIVVQKSIEPTCTTDGITDGSYCSICNTVIREQTVIPKLNHINSNWFIYAEKSCTDDGLMYQWCYDCEDIVQTETIPAGHDIETVEAVEAGCLTIGWDEYEKCSMCNYTTYIEQKPTGHTFGEETCTGCSGILISSVEDFSNINPSGTYILANDIDFNGATFEPILSFEGLFDGNGHKIIDLCIKSSNTSYVGFIRLNYGTIRNLGLENITITATKSSASKGDWIFLGAFAGENHGKIYNCYATGTLNGKVYSSDYATHLYASTDSAYAYIGGLAGGNYGNIENCFSDCEIIGYSSSSSYSQMSYSESYAYCYAHSLIGTNKGTIANCYAIGNSTAETKANAKGASATCRESASVSLLSNGTEGISTNCYSYSGQILTRISYGKTSTFTPTYIEGKTMNQNDLYSKDFHTNVLGWSTDVWNFQYNQHPTLIVQSE